MTSGLTKFYAFFETWGKERLDGLDASHCSSVLARRMQMPMHVLALHTACWIVFKFGMAPNMISYWAICDVRIGNSERRHLAQLDQQSRS